MKLSDWRRKNRRTQREIAEVIGVDPTMISKYERELAKPTIYHLAIIHRITNREVTVEDFLYGVEKTTVNQADYLPRKNSLYRRASDSHP